MIALLSAELLRLRTVRTYWLLAACAIAVIAAATALNAAASSFGPGTSAVRSALVIAGIAQTVALLAGVLSVTGEFRHRTIAAAALITPRRLPLLAAKVVTMTAAGLAFGLLATGIATAIALPLLAARHIPAGISGEGVVAIVGGGGIATALSAALGVGAGTIIRNQVGAIVTVLAFLYVAEPLLGFVPHLGTAIQQYGLAGLVGAADNTANSLGTAPLLGQADGILVLTGYAAVTLLAAATALDRRDLAA